MPIYEHTILRKCEEGNMKKTDLARFAITWLLGYALMDRLLPINNWILRVCIAGSVVSAILGVAIHHQLYCKKLERARKLVDWTQDEHLMVIQWNQIENTMSVLQVQPLVGQSRRLDEEIVHIDAIMDTDKKDLYVPMEGIHITPDDGTILEEEGDALLLKQEKVWLRIPDSDIIREFFVNAN